jgi:hypothetical protein
VKKEPAGGGGEVELEEEEALKYWPSAEKEQDCYDEEDLEKLPSSSKRKTQQQWQWQRWCSRQQV